MGWTRRLVAAVAFTVVASCVCPAVLTVDLVTTDAFFAVHNKVSGEEVRLTHDGAWEVEGRLQCGNGALGNETLQPCPLVDGLADTLRRLRVIRVLAWMCLVPLAVLRLPLVAGMLWAIRARCLGTRRWAWPAVCLCTVGMLANCIVCIIFVRSVPLTDAHDWVVVPTTPSFLLTLLWNETVLLLLTVGDVLGSKQVLADRRGFLLFKLMVFLIGTAIGAPGVWRPFSFMPGIMNKIFMLYGCSKVVTQACFILPGDGRRNDLNHMVVLLLLPLFEFFVWTICFSAARPPPYITFFVDYTDSFVFPLMPMPTLALMTRACILYIMKPTSHEVLPIPDEWSTDNALQAIDVDAAHKELLEEALLDNDSSHDAWMIAVREDSPRQAPFRAVPLNQNTFTPAVRGMCGRLLVALLAELEGEALGQLLQCLMQTDWGRLLLRSTTALSRRHPSAIDHQVVDAVSCGGLLHLHTCVRGVTWHLCREGGRICSFYSGNTKGAVAQCLTSFGFPLHAESLRSCCSHSLVQVQLAAGGADPPSYPYIFIALFLAVCVTGVALHAVYDPRTTDGMGAWLFVAFLAFVCVCILVIVVPGWMIARLSTPAAQNPLVGPPEGGTQYLPAHPDPHTSARESTPAAQNPLVGPPEGGTQYLPVHPDPHTSAQTRDPQLAGGTAQNVLQPHTRAPCSASCLTASLDTHTQPQGGTPPQCASGPATGSLHVDIPWGEPLM